MTFPGLPWLRGLRAAVMRGYDAAVRFEIERHRLMLAFFAGLLVLTCYGFAHLQFDSSMTTFFRNTTELSRNYESYLRRFEASDRDVLLVLSSETPLDAARMQTARLVHLDLSFIEGVSDVFSVFSLRTQPDANGTTAPLIPEPLPQGAAFDEMLQRVGGDRDLTASFLSADRRDLLMVVTIPPDYDPEFNPTVLRIEEMLAEHYADTGMTIGLTGYNVMRSHIRRAARHDMVTFNTAGFLVGFVIAFMTLGSFRYVVIASAPPALAVVLIIGAQGLFGIPLQSLTTIVPSLVLLVVFNNSTHLVFETRRRIAAGDSPAAAIRNAMHTIGPPCALSTFITAVAVFTLAWTPSAAVRNFGWIGSLATLGGMACVFLVLPPLSAIMLVGASPQSAGRESGPVRVLRRLSIRMGATAARHARLLMTLGCVAVLIAGALYWQLQPRLRMSDQMPRNSDTLAATAVVDHDFGGINLVAIVIDDGRREGTPLDPEFRSLVAEVDAAVRALPQAAGVISLATVERMAGGAENLSPERFAAIVGELPPSLQNRLVSRDGKAALVTFRLPDLYASELAAILGPLQSRLATIGREHPAASIALTGLATLVAFEGPRMIAALQQNNVQTFLFAIVLIGLFFRSPRLMIAALPVNLLPLLAVGAGLHLIGRDIDFAASIALTVALGLSVDDTIHIIHRWRLLHGRGYRKEARMARVLGAVGPVVMLTTLMLIAGMSVSRFSINPNLLTFSAVMSTVLLLTLICQCVLLPAMLAGTSRATDKGLRIMAKALGRSAAAIVLGAVAVLPALVPGAARAQSGYEALEPFAGEWRGTGVGRESANGSEESILCLSSNEMQESRFVILARCNTANARVVFNAWLNAEGGAYAGTYQRTTRSGGEQRGTISGGGQGTLTFDLTADGAARGRATLRGGGGGYSMTLVGPEGGAPLLEVTFAPQ